MPKVAIVSGWRQTTLGKHVRIHSGSSPSQVQLDSKGAYPFIKVEDLNNFENTSYQVGFIQIIEDFVRLQVL